MVLLWEDERSRAAVAALADSKEHLSKAEMQDIYAELDRARAGVLPKSKARRRQ